MRRSCGRRSRSTRPPAEMREILQAQSRGSGDPRQVERSGVPAGRVAAQPEAQGHAVRRLPRPRLEFPRGLQARSQGHAARQGRQGGRRRRSREIHARRCTCRRSTWTSGMHCVDCHFGQDAHGNGHIYGEVAAAIEIDCADCHGTAEPVSQPVHVRPGGAARRHRSVAPAHAGRPQALRVARRQALPALGARSRQGMGDDAGQGHRQSGPPEVQREGRAREADERATRRCSGAPAWIRPSSRTATTR